MITENEEFLTDIFLISCTEDLINIKKNNKPIKLIIYNPYSKDSITKAIYAPDIKKEIDRLERKIYSHVKKFYPEMLPKKIIDK
jgi:hypothetical protein